MIRRRRRRRGRRPRPKWTPSTSTSTVLTPNRLLAAAVLLLLTCPLAMPSFAPLATGEDGTISDVLAAPNGAINQSSRPERAVTNGPSGGVPLPGTDFATWINQTQGDLKDPFLNRSQYTEGEVVLFAPRKSHHHRHRATNRITVVSSSSTTTSIDGGTMSRISDSVSLKEWLKRAFAEEKALKVSVRSTEALRPVLLHLYAARRYFRTPVIIHADTFDCGGDSNDAPLSSNGRLGREGEKLVDAASFVHSVHSILPDAVISLGWSDSPSSGSSNRSMQSNCLDWSRAFWLVGQLLGGQVDQQPVLLNMNVRDALRALPQLEWLLGARGVSVYLLLHGRVTDLADVENPVSRLRELIIAASSRQGGQRVLFDVDDMWRRRLGRSLESNVSGEDKKGSAQASADWINVAFPSPHAILSTSVVSAGGMAFLGWPSSLLVSTRGRHSSYPSRQSLRGRVIFLAKRQLSEIHPVGGENGLAIYLFDHTPTRSDTWDSEELNLHEPSVKQSVTALIGYDGRVSLENDLVPTSHSDEHYVKSSSAQLPQWPCYGFELRDRGWRVEMEAWTEPVVECGLATNAGGSGKHITSRSYLRLDTPITPSRRSRTMAIGKRGDGAIDFLVQGMEHSSSGGGGSSSASKSISQETTHIVTLCALLSLLLVPKL